MSPAQGEAVDRFGSRYAERLRQSSRDLTRSWLELLHERLGVVPKHRIFPTDSLLNHIPHVLESLADFVAAVDNDLDSRFVVDDLEDLARLRRRQGYDLEEILHEFSVLGHLLFREARLAARSHRSEDEEVVAVMARLHDALSQVSSTTALSYSRAASEDRQARGTALERFGRIVSHEMRNRLNFARLSLAEWQSRRESSEEQERKLSQAVESSLCGLGDLADDVYALALAQSTEEASWARRRPLSTVVEQLVESSRSLARSRGVEIAIRGELPAVAVDATRLELAMVNLVVNALRHARPVDGAPWVEIAVSRLDGDDGWRVAITDNGLGIPEEVRRRVFGAGEEAASVGSPDTGIGLALAREAMTQLGGNIELHSSSEEGTTFYLSVPDPPAA